MGESHPRVGQGSEVYLKDEGEGRVAMNDLSSDSHRTKIKVLSRLRG